MIDESVPDVSGKEKSYIFSSDESFWRPGPRTIGHHDVLSKNRSNSNRSQLTTSSLRCNTEVTEGVVDHVHVHPPKILGLLQRLVAEVMLNACN